MGNTNHSRTGAADGASKQNQFTDQKKARPDKGDVGPAPSRPKNAPPRIPGQLRDPHEKETPGSSTPKHDRSETLEQAGRPRKP